MRHRSYIKDDGLFHPHRWGEIVDLAYGVDRVRIANVYISFSMMQSIESMMQEE